ncbi:hypothetical protein [Rhodococcus sp. NPDC003348]
MTRRDGTESGLISDEPIKPARKWTWPKHLGRMRTSTVLLIVGFLAAALLRGYFIQGEPQPNQETGVQAPAAETTSQPVPQRSTTTVHATTPTTVTTTPSPSASSPSPAEAGTSATPTTSPLIVLPPGLVPSGVELPPGVVVETTTEPAPTTP